MVLGIDEAGAGAWAGPLSVAGCLLEEDFDSISGLTDSKKLTPIKRDKLFDEISLSGIPSFVTMLPPSVVDEINVLEARMLGMRLIIERVLSSPHKDLVSKILIDGNKAPSMPDLEIPLEVIIKGDVKVKAISAASIVAKVTRDRVMRDLAQQYPGYSFEANKGYGTKAHTDALESKGPCAIHRVSYMPVREALERLKQRGG